ncbi:HEAT repeat domain-containing protein [Streptomyces durmitorensis]|uniref:HEAT repeat domain-containing protein n=1 Tax=Streptomyces durmitorensis TaxID=319947 RepID=A0ABY4PTM9_9ACTN|nr:HEAT repeat domain-containing protein [Streptomyces durmitorensis]UQT56293.1 HEAT repeat domain-containing protein [Streptomyces durmitorensis]
MPHSKSHIDRVLKAQTLPAPVWPFTQQFLMITSRAAGLTAEEHRERLSTAKALVQDVENARSAELVHDGATPAESEHEAAVAALRLEVDLERARHTETRLRYALRDAQFLMATLWSIISALRDIISDHAVLAACAQRDGAGPGERARLHDETRLAISHKQSADAEATRVESRIRTLETLWEQAGTELRRLSLHPEAAGLPAPSDDPPQPSRPSRIVIPHELLAQPALDDIAAALHRVHMVNAQEELAVVGFEHDVTPAGMAPAGGEFTVLVAATHLTDPDNRRSALTTLLATWLHRPEAQGVVIRLTADPERDLRQTAAEALAVHWAGDLTALTAVLALFLDSDEGVRATAAEVTAQGWAGHAEARDALIGLIHDVDLRVRCAVVEALADGWAGDVVARDAVVVVAGDHSEWPYEENTWRQPLRARAAGSLARGWARDTVARDAVTSLGHDPDADVRGTLPGTLASGWTGDPVARDLVVALARDSSYLTRLSAAMSLPDGWRGDPVAREAVVRLCHDKERKLPTIAARALKQGWPQT